MVSNMKGEDEKLFLGVKQFSFGQFRSFAAVNDSTLRAWMKRHLPDIGEKMPNGKMLFSGVDCIYIRLFSELTTKKSITPKAAQKISHIGLSRVLELVLLSKSDFDEYEPIFHVYEKVTDDFTEYLSMTKGGIFQLFESISAESLLIVPIDNIFLSTQESLFKVLERDRLKDSK